MGIMIHGLDMPKEYGTGVGIYHNGVCLVLTEKEATMGKPIWAERLPPHGRLIDADTILDNLMQEMRKKNYDEKRILILAGVMDMIDSAPTIIEAEGEREK